MPGLAARVRALKRYQQRRFEFTYADLLAHPRYAGASNFFLEELYGPSDFTQRDSQFARIVPALVRLFPAEVVATVQALAALHALSETFDSAMGRALASDSVDAASYALAWQDCGHASGREQQIAMMERVGQSLDGLTRNALLHHSLRLMRGAGAGSRAGRAADLPRGGIRHLSGHARRRRVPANRRRARACLGVDPVLHATGRCRRG